MCCYPKIPSTQIWIARWTSKPIANWDRDDNETGYGRRSEG